MRPPHRLLSSIFALLVAAPLSAAADDVGASGAAGAPAVVGHVTNLSGSAVAERPGEPARPLHCRDAVYEGDRVVTADDSHVGVLMSDVFAHVGKQSRLLVQRTPDAASDLSLEQGAVRVIDPRDDGSRARLGVLDARAAVLGNDAEAYVFVEKAGAYAMLCEWDAPLPVSRADENAVARAGECVVAKRREPLYLADAHAQRLGSPALDQCAIPVVWGGPDLHLDPSQVASGPLLDPWSGPGAGVPLPPRSPCDVPGSGCAGVIEPPATGGPIFPVAGGG